MDLKGVVKRRVLVVDDNIDNARSIALLLHSMGHTVEYSINGIVGLDMAARFKPEIVFLDLLLPDTHGAEVCAQLRLNPELRHTRIFGITASRRTVDHERARSAGCDDVLLKPINADTYERILCDGATRAKTRRFGQHGQVLDGPDGS